MGLTTKERDIQMNAIEFINNSQFPSLAEAVIDQSGGWESFEESAVDVARYGANCGYSGFIYYSETCGFFDANRQSIIRALSDSASDIGSNVIDMVSGFSCLSDIDKSDIEAILFGFEPSDECSETQVKNALAWFALELVCFDFANFAEA